MALKDRVRRALNRSPSTSPPSTQNTTPTSSSAPSRSHTPNPSQNTFSPFTSNPPSRAATFSSSTPSENTLTKTLSGLKLSKTLTFGRRLSKEEEARKRIEKWERMDEIEWREGRGSRPKFGCPLKGREHMELLRGFEMNFGRSCGGRKDSGWSGEGVSPGGSRCASLEIERREGGGLGGSALSREVGGVEVDEVD